MSLERKDLRLKLDPDAHQALALLAAAHDVDMSAWAEKILVREVRHELHRAMVIAEQARRLGISGSSRESAGTSGSDRE